MYIDGQTALMILVQEGIYYDATTKQNQIPKRASIIAAKLESVLSKKKRHIFCSKFKIKNLNSKKLTLLQK
jgi:hypothetical protein